MNEVVVYLETESGAGEPVYMTEEERADLIENELVHRWDCGRHSFTEEAIKIITGE